MNSDAPPPRSRAARVARRYGPVIAIAVAFGLVVASGLHRRISLAGVSERYADLLAFTQVHPIACGLGFVAFYAFAVTISLPGSLWFTILGGLLFGWFWGAIYSWAGATVGATLIFLAARTALKDVLRARVGSRLDQFRDGFERNAFFYLVMLRIVPLPFFLVNIAPAFFNVSARTFMSATALGVIPASIAYAILGDGAGDIIASGEAPNLSLFAQPKIFAAFISLASLAAAAVAVRRYWSGAGRV